MWRKQILRSTRVTYKSCARVEMKKKEHTVDGANALLEVFAVDWSVHGALALAVAAEPGSSEASIISLTEGRQTSRSIAFARGTCIDV